MSLIGKSRTHVAKPRSKPRSAMGGSTAMVSPFTHSNTPTLGPTANGVDAPTVMEYSGHKSFQSFSSNSKKRDMVEKRA